MAVAIAIAHRYMTTTLAFLLMSGSVSLQQCSVRQMHDASARPAPFFRILVCAMNSLALLTPQVKHW